MKPKNFKSHKQLAKWVLGRYIGKYLDGPEQLAYAIATEYAHQLGLYLNCSAIRPRDITVMQTGDRLTVMLGLELQIIIMQHDHPETRILW